MIEVFRGKWGTTLPRDRVDTFTEEEFNNYLLKLEHDGFVRVIGPFEDGTYVVDYGSYSDFVTYRIVK